MKKLIETRPDYDNTESIIKAVETIQKNGYKKVVQAIFQCLRSERGGSDNRIIYADNSSISLGRYSITKIRFIFSYNEPKIYVECGALEARLIDTPEAIRAAFKAIEKMRRTFTKELINHEL